MLKTLALVGTMALALVSGISQAVPAPLVASGGDGSGSDIQSTPPIVPFGGDGSGSDIQSTPPIVPFGGDGSGS